ncbi:RICIN domain-containing protein [Viscerimonas tarda]
MKKIYTFSMTMLLSLFSLAAVAQVSIDASTAWWNNETFESYTWGENNDGWSSANAKIQDIGSSATTGTAIDQVLAFTTAASWGTGSNFTNISKSFSSLSGALYVKTSFHHGTRGSKYALYDSDDQLVFEFGGINSSSSPVVFFTGKTAAEVGLSSTRDKWTDVEFVLDLSANKILKIILTHGDNTKTFENFDLSTTTTATQANVKTLKVTSNEGYARAGLDNTTIAQLLADNIKSLAGDTELQTLDATEVSKTYSVTAFTTAMGVDVNVAAGTKANIAWTISDWGTLPVGEQANVSLTRSATDYASATLITTGVVPADATITLKAKLGDIEVTKTVTLKTANASALLAELNSEIAIASALDDAVTDANPYLTSVIGTLTTAIGVAQNVYDNSTDATAIQTAIETLKTAELTFTAALAIYDNYVAYIATVQEAHDAELRAQDFFTTIKAPLASAIGTANGAKATVSSTGAITAAQTALEDALTAFNEAISHFTGLEASIASATTAYNAANVRVGTKFLNYAAAGVESLNAAISDANTALSAETTTTALDAAKATVENALTLSRIAPGEIQYKIYTYGESNSNTPSDKKTLYVDESGGTPALKSMLAADVAEDTANKWTIVETAANQYTIQNVATGKYLTVVGLSDAPATISLPETKAGSANIITVDDGYFFYGIKVDSNYLRQRNADLALQSYGSDLGRFDTAFQFEEVGGPTTLLPSVLDSDKVIGVQYYNLQGTAVAYPAKGGLYIVKTRLESGKVMAKKVFIK